MATGLYETPSVCLWSIMILGCTHSCKCSIWVVHLLGRVDRFVLVDAMSQEVGLINFFASFKVVFLVSY